MRGVRANKPALHAASVGAHAAWLEDADARIEFWVAIQGVQAGRPSRASNTASAGTDATRSSK
jgi:hypothetical protein